MDGERESIVTTVENEGSDMSADASEAAPEATDGTPEARLNRRRMMQAALAGGAAAAVWSAPRIEGLSIAPDYASAATCTTSSPDFGLTATNCWANINVGNLYRCCAICWNNTSVYCKATFTNCDHGNGGNANYGCGDSTNNAINGSLSINRTGSGATPLKLDYSIWGGLTSGDTPYLNLSFPNAIDPPFQNCAVSVNGSCTGKTFLPQPGNNNTTFTQSLVNAGTTIALQPRCNNTFDSYWQCNGNNATVTITLSCTCT